MIFAFMGFVLIFLFSALFPQDDHRPMFFFMVCGLVLSFANLIAALWRRWRNLEKPHTRYTGRPILMRFLPFGEVAIKRLELWLVIAAGWLCIIATSRWAST